MPKTSSSLALTPNGPLSALVGIAFDLDDTLCSRQEAFARFIAKEIERAPEHTLDFAQLSHLDRRGYGDKRVLLAYLARCFRWQEQEHEQRYGRYCREQVAAVDPDPAVLALVRRLSARYRLGLISNGRSQMQRGKLTRLGLSHYFEPTLISEEVGSKKPDRAMFLPLIQAFGCRPEQILVVGDHPEFDVLAARSLGMQAVWVSAGRPWTYGGPAPAMVDSVLELEALLPLASAAT